MKGLSLKISIISLLVSNAWLLIQLWQKHFAFGDVLLVYWLEIAIVGGFLSLKLLISYAARGKGLNKIGEIIIALLYSAVMFVAAVFVPMFVSLIGITYYIPGGLEKESWVELIQPGVWHAASLLLASHAISFLVNFIGHTEYKKWAAESASHNSRTGPDLDLIGSRFHAVLFACLGGGVLALFAYALRNYTSLPSISATTFAITLFIIIKIAFDIRGHLKEHAAT
jgi:hypothetical protein